METKTMIINVETYNELITDSNFLSCLKNAGVDNWDGYEFAREEFAELYGDDA